MLFSAFKYNVAFWPRKLVEKVGNLVYYESKFPFDRDNSGGYLTIFKPDHDFGGHFGGVDNPPALLYDLREIGVYWK